jgi:hypothetical protein
VRPAAVAGLQTSTQDIWLQQSPRRRNGHLCRQNARINKHVIGGGMTFSYNRTRSRGFSPGLMAIRIRNHIIEMFERSGRVFDSGATPDLVRQPAE